MTPYDNWLFNYAGKLNRCIKRKLSDRDTTKRKYEDEIHKHPHIYKFLITTDMADKIFVGRTFEDRWGNPEVVLTIDDLQKLNQHMKDGKVKMVSKKSKEGKWYSEIDTWQPTAVDKLPSPLPNRLKAVAETIEPVDDLPF